MLQIKWVVTEWEDSLLSKTSEEDTPEEDSEEIMDMLEVEEVETEVEEVDEVDMADKVESTKEEETKISRLLNASFLNNTDHASSETNAHLLTVMRI